MVDQLTGAGRVEQRARVLGMDDPRRCCDNLAAEPPRRRTHGQCAAPRSCVGRSDSRFHWLIVALVAAAYATWRLNWMVWHGWIGDAVLALVLFRLLWGFLGGETARFSHFLTSPPNGR